MEECKNNEEVREFGLSEVFAWFVRKFPVILIVAVAGMTAGLAYAKISSAKANANVPEIVSSATSESSVTVRYFAVGVSPDVSGNLSEKDIEEKILQWWKVFDVHSVTGSSGCVAELEHLNSGIFRLMVTGNKADDTQKVSYQLYSAVKDFTDKLGTVVIQVVSQSTEQTSQSRVFTEIVSSSTVSARYGLRAAIGFVAGGALAVFALFIAFIARGFVTGSEDLKMLTKAPLTGVFPADRKFFAVLAAKITGEMTWKTEDERQQWFDNNFSTFVSDPSRTVCLCSLPREQVGDIEKRVKCEVLFDSCRNSSVNEKVAGADCVILIERQWVSVHKAVRTEVETVERLGKKICGFVLC